MTTWQFVVSCCLVNNFYISHKNLNSQYQILPDQIHSHSTFMSRPIIHINNIINNGQKIVIFRNLINKQKKSILKREKLKTTHYIHMIFLSAVLNWLILKLCHTDTIIFFGWLHFIHIHVDAFFYDFIMLIIRHECKKVCF